MEVKVKLSLCLTSTFIISLRSLRLSAKIFIVDLKYIETLHNSSSRERDKGIKYHTSLEL